MTSVLFNVKYLIVNRIFLLKQDAKHFFPHDNRAIRFTFGMLSAVVEDIFLVIFGK